MAKQTEYDVEPRDCEHPASQLVEESKYGEAGMLCMMCGRWFRMSDVVSLLVGWFAQFTERMETLEQKGQDDVDDTK